MNLAALIESHPDAAVALRHDGRTITYGELRKRVAILRRELVARGVGPGDRVALVIPTTPAFVSAYFAVLGVGAAAVPLNPESPLAELASELGTVRRPQFCSAAPELRGCEAPSRTSAIPSWRSARTASPPIGRRTNGGPEDGGPEDGGPIVERSIDDAAVLLFTSGTAGLPKAAILTHGSLRANIDQMSLAVGLAVSADDVGLLVVPPFHIYGLNAVLGLHLFAGGRLVLMERFDAASLLETIVREQVTVLPGVPQLFTALSAVDSATGEELGAVRVAVSGAAPLSPEVAERFEERFGVRIWQAYGLTEASPTVTFPDMNAPWHPTAVGVPLPGIEVEIVDADGDRVEHGSPGRYSSGAPISSPGTSRTLRRRKQLLTARDGCTPVTSG